MRTRLLIFISFCLLPVFKINAQDVVIDADHFPDAVFRQWVSKNADADENGVLSQGEIENVTQIAFGASAVASLEGIQYFTKLTLLDVNGCKNLKTVDLSPFPLLEKAVFQFSGITSCTLAGNTSLKTLDLYYAKVPDLDLSSCVNLEDLNVSNSSLTSLDVSNNKKLLTLDCSWNSLLSQLDLSQNTSLESLDISNTSISAIDVSNNSQLTRLDISSTKISSIDLSQNTGLIELGFSQTKLSSPTQFDIFPDLKYLYCTSTKVPSLKLDQNANLEILRCGGTLIQTLDVTKNTKLRVLECPSTALTTLDLAQNTLLTELNINDCTIKNIDLSNNTSLSTLHADGGLEYPETGLDTLILTANVKLKYLYISDVRFKGVDLTKNAELLILEATQSALQHLNVDYCPKLKELRLYGCVGIEAINLSENGLLQSLNCASTSVVHLDLSKNPLLKSLSCSKTRITELSVVDNPKLESLYASDNRISEIDLSINELLVYLDLGRTDITTIDLSASQKLKSVSLVGTPLNTLVLGNEKPSLKTLILTSTRIDTLETSFLPSIIELYVDSTNLEYCDMTPMSKLSSFRCTMAPIRYLDLSKSESLAYLYANRCRLSNLDFSVTNRLSFASVFGNYTVQTVNRKNELDLSKLPGFDPERSRHWINAEREGDILRLKEGVDTTSYYYMTHFSPEGSEELVSNDSIRIGMKVEMEPIIADTVLLSISANDFEMVRDQAPTYTVSIEVPANSNVIDEPHDAVQLKIDLKKQGEEVPVSRLQYIDLPTVGPLGDPATGTFTLEAVAVLENYLTEAGTYDITYSLVNASDKKVYEGEYWVLKQGTPMTLTVREKVPYPVADPVILPEDDLVALGDKVSITCATPEAQIFYSLGKDVKPTFLYGDDTDLEITQGVTYVNAYTLYVDEDTSEVFSRKFKVAVEPVIFKPTSGYVEKGDTIYLSCATPGATIEFSMGEGVEPFELYEDTVIVITDDYTVLNAWAYFPDGDTTRIYTEEYNAKAPPGYVDGSEVYLPTNLQAFPSRDSVWLVWDAHYDHIYEAYVADSSSGEVVFEDTVSEFGLHTDFMLSGLEDGVYTWKVRVVGLEISPETIFDTVTEYVEGPNFRIDRSVSNGGLGPWLWEDGGIAGLLSKVVVYPNPSSGEFYLRFPSSLLSLGNPLVEVFSLQGMKLFSQEVSASPMYFNLQGLETGVFFLRISLREGSVSRRIVIF